MNDNHVRQPGNGNRRLSRNGFGHVPLGVYESQLNRFRTLAIFRTLLSDRMGHTSISANFTFSGGWALTAEQVVTRL